jgi:hypothetical protein
LLLSHAAPIFKRLSEKAGATHIFLPNMHDFHFGYTEIIWEQPWKVLAQKTDQEK